MKKVVSVLTAMMLSVILVLPIMATGNIGGGTPVPDSDTTETHKPDISGGFDYSAPDDPADIMGIENVTVEDLTERVNEKGNDVVNILQSIGKWVCIGAFVIAILVMLFGCFGNQKLLWQGLIGMIIAGIAYAGIVFGREIVMFIASWAAS